MEFLDLVQEQDEKIQKLLLELPALITLYGVNHDGKINKREKEAVAHLLRVDTYNSDAFLQSYYNIDDIGSNIQSILNNQKLFLNCGLQCRRSIESLLFFCVIMTVLCNLFFADCYNELM